MTSNTLDATRTVAEDALDRLLNTLSVQICGFLAYRMSQDTRVVFDPTDSVSIYYVITGNGCLRLASGANVPLAPRSIVIVPERCSQSLGSSDADTEARPLDHSAPIDEELVALMAAETAQQNITMVRSEILATYGGAMRLFDLLREPIVHDFSTGDPARLAFEMMIAEIANPAAGSHALVEALLKQFLILVLRSHVQKSADPPLILTALRDHRLSQTIFAILDHPEMAHTMKSLAAAAGMSRSSFSGRFRDAFGQTPVDFIKAVRLRRAAHLLKTSNLAIKVIATSIGYSSRSHFSRAFRVIYGTDPSAFRKKD